MKKSTIIILMVMTLASWPFFLFSQVDYSAYDKNAAEYWLMKMKDPNTNYFEFSAEAEQHWANRTPEKGDGYKLFKRWQNFVKYYVDENGKIHSPAETIKAALDHAQQYAGDAIVGTWESMGPEEIDGSIVFQYPCMGRISGLAFHPTDANTLYAGTPLGGAWITTDGGGNWSPMNTDQINTLGVSAIAVDPNMPSVIYIGMGDRDGGFSRGHGIYKSSDGGNTWVQKDFNNGGLLVINKIVIKPGSPKDLAVATNIGVFVSGNFGNSWNKGLGLDAGVMDMVCKPDNPDVLYATANGILYKSYDFGQSWCGTLVTKGHRGAVAVTPDNPEKVYCLESRDSKFYRFYVSNNAGISWDTVNTTAMSNEGQGGYNLDLAVDPTNENIIYAGFVNIYKSTNGGQSWTKKTGLVNDTHADQHLLEFSPLNGKLYIGNDGGVFVSDDGCNSFDIISHGLQAAELYFLDVKDDDPSVILSGHQDGGCYVDNAGVWTHVSGGDGFWTKSDPNNNNIYYTTSQGGTLYRTSAGLYSSYFAIAGMDINGINQSGSWYSPFVLDKNSSNIMFMGEKDLWRSTNVNTTYYQDVEWENISAGQLAGGDNNIDFIEQSPADGNRLYIIQSSKYFYRSINALSANPTFVQRSKPPGDLHWFEAHPTNPDIVYMICGWSVYKSTNNGNAWVNITGSLPSIPKLCILYQEGSNEGLYVGTAAGVYYKDADMTDWVLFKSGLPMTHVSHMEINYTTNPPQLFAATFGRGLWKTEVVPTFKPNIVGTSGNASVNGTTVTLIQGLSNQSQFNTTGDFHVGFYVSTNDIIGTGDTKIGEVPISDMAPGMIMQASLDPVNVEIVEPLLPAGTYYFGAYADNQYEVDELDENDNRYLAPVQVIIPANSPAPVNVAASDGTYSNRIFITWENPTDDQLFYAVYRANVNNPEIAVRITPSTWITPLSYSDYSISPGTDYYYWVKASRYNTGIRSSDFSTVNAGWRQLGVPTNVQATDGQYSVRVTVTWTAPENATHFRVYRSIINNPSLSTNISGASWIPGAIFHDLTAAAGSTYYYWVKAAMGSDGFRSSAFSNTDIGYIAFADAPVVTASDGIYTDKVALSWTTISAAPYYKLFRGTTSNPDASTPLTGWQTATTFNDASAAVGSVYYYFVKASNDAVGTITTGYSAAETGWRNFVPPANLQATDGAFIERTDVTWNASSGASHYKVYRHTQGNFANASPITNWMTATSFSDITSVPGLTYYYWVVPAGDTLVTIGQPAGSESGWCLLNSPDVSATKGFYADHVHVTWGSVNGGVAYRVYRSPIGSSIPVALTDWSTSLNFQYDDYTAVQAEQYWYYVKAARNTGGLRESDYGQDIGFADDCGNMIEDPAYRSVTIEGSTIIITTRIINEGPYALANPGQIAFALEDAAPFGITDFMLGYADIPPLAVGAHYDVNFSADLNAASPAPVTLGTWYVSCFTSWDFNNCDANMNDDYVVWESMPFDYTDALYGEYSVGPVAGDFYSLDKVILALNARGISGQVIFNLEPSVFVEQFELGPVEGCTPDHNIIFRTDPAAKGDTAEIVFAPSELYNYTIRLNNASNITFENLKLSSYGFTNYMATYGTVIDITGNCSNIQLTNNLIKGYSDDSYTNDENVVIMCHDGIISNIIIEENTILYGSTAIKIEGLNLNPDPVVSPVIRNNQIINFIFSGIDLTFCDDIEISGNYLFTPEGSERVGYGILLDRIRNGIILTENNIAIHTLSWSCTGILDMEVNLDGGQRGLIANNMVAINGNNSNMYGVYLFEVFKTDIYHNSMHISGTQDSFSADMMLDCSDGPIWGYDNNLKDNIFMNSTGGLCLVYNDNAFNHLYLAESDYNNYKSSGQYIIMYKSVNFFETLTGWINAMGFDGHSLMVDPQFVSDMDLHLNSQELDGMGYPVAEVYRDIDGDPRDLVHPDMGADEYDYVASGFSIDLRAYLQGPYSGGMMSTNLNMSGYLPLSQPFNQIPWNYSGTETVGVIPNANVVDWVLIELRDAPSAAQATSGTVVARNACFMLKSGVIRSLDGNSLPGFNFTILNNLYIVIYHRNHLAVMNASAMPEASGIYSWNYFTGVNQVYGGATAHKQIVTGVWGMVSGDGNSDGMVNNMDKNNVWKVQTGLAGYYKGDFNMNGQVENTDKNNNWKPNSGSGSQVPN